MRDIAEMISIVKDNMRQKNINVIEGRWINGNRNYYLRTESHGSFVLKHSAQWFNAGLEVPAIGKGAGMAFNLKTYKELSMSYHKPTFLFGIPTSNNVYFQTWDEFTRLSEETIQPFNGEPVRVILTRRLNVF